MPVDPNDILKLDLTFDILRKRIIDVLKLGKTTEAGVYLKDVVQYWGEDIHAMPEAVPAIIVNEVEEDMLEIEDNGPLGKWTIQWTVRVIVEAPERKEARTNAQTMFYSCFNALSRYWSLIVDPATQQGINRVFIRRILLSTYMQNSRWSS